MLKRGIIHSRERVEKTNHTRCEIENVKVKPPHEKRKEKCSNNIFCPVEEDKKRKIVFVGCLQKDLAVQERMTKKSS